MSGINPHWLLEKSHPVKTQAPFINPEAALHRMAVLWLDLRISKL